ncbi:DUF3786 domain-containing protein [Thermodesulfobacteriota bacterium]
MGKPNTIFDQNYDGYLQKVRNIDFSNIAPILKIRVNAETSTAEIPFFNTTYRVSPFGVVDEQGQRPDYAICVILLKYLLLNPQWVPAAKDWVTYRDFTDSGQTQDAGLSEYALAAIAKRYAGNLERLKASAGVLGSNPPEAEYPYDFSAVFPALPRLPILFLFNDADEQFPAHASILYERRADHYLDAECRVMVDWYLFESLKKAEIL